MSERVDPAQLLRDIANLERQGREAAAPDGLSLLLVGSLGGVLFLPQYWAEARDWAPSFLLWWWQPLLILAWAGLLLTRHGLTGTAALGAEARSLQAVFLAVACALLVPLLAQAYRGEVNGYAAALVLCTALGGAFTVLGRVLRARWMLLPAAGWWALLFVFVARGHLVLSDFMLLAGACLGLLGLPGLLLWLRKRHGRAAGGRRS